MIDKIICVGKNYLEHAKELGDAIPEKPVLFLKPPSVLKTVMRWQDTLYIPDLPQDANIQPECEIVLHITTGGYRITREQAENMVGEVSLGLDMTLRTRQTQLKKNGHPWTTAKVFPDAAIIGPWISLKEFHDYLDTPFSLSINDKICQQAKGTEMMMNPVELLVYISSFFPLCAGDIIFTGTPAGVSPISANDQATLSWGNHSFSVIWK